MEMLWTIFVEVMAQAQTLYRCEFHAFILMSNHYHLLVSTPGQNIDKVMEHIQRDVAKKANRESIRINHFFGGPYKWSLIYEESYYWNVIKYIFRNPIRAGICKTVTDYRFSSLNLHHKEFRWRMVDFFNDKTKSIVLDNDWLNEPFLNEAEGSIRLALRRKEFKIPRRKNGHRLNIDSSLSKK
jgi:putative transposase